ncbi:MAG: peptidylprolyl isomerase [Rhodanobacter sp.]|nr:peptidylprolyl isomerase [Rhodanobacter sp.]
MNVETNKVVSFHYTVRDGGAEPVDSSRERGEPLTVLIGHGHLISGLEKAMMGHAVGDRFAVSVPPADGYGERREDHVQRVSKKYFKDADHLRPGMITVLKTREEGARAVVVKKVGSSVVDIDLNHPMAGKTLAFDIKITDIREATPEELAHGHAHGVGGHQH